MGEITTNLQGGRHASRGGVKGRRKSCRPPQNSETSRTARLDWGRVRCECGRARGSAALSGTGTRGCTEPERCRCRRPGTSVHTPKLGMQGRTEPLHKPIKSLRPRAGAVMSEKRRRATLSSSETETLRRGGKLSLLFWGVVT